MSGAPPVGYGCNDVQPPERLRRPPGLRRPSRDARFLGRSVFPIVPWDRLSDEESLMDTDYFGSAFFVTVWGAFITAKHVVAGAPSKPPLRVLFQWQRYDGALLLYAAEVRQLELHPELDVAFGVAEVPSWLPRGPQTLRLSTRPLDVDDRVAVYGFSHTVTPTAERPNDPFAMWPVDHHGRVFQVRSPGSQFYRGMREYVVNAETLGGTSGAPLVKRSTLEVHGVISTGIADACGFATDTREFLENWSLAPLGGLSIAEFSSRYPRALRVTR